MIARIESSKVESSLVIKAWEPSPKWGDIRTTREPSGGEIHYCAANGQGAWVYG
jgi:hypothetical protein